MVPFSNLFVGTLLRRSFASSRGFLDPALASGKSIASRLLSKTIGSIKASKAFVDLSIFQIKAL